MTDLYATALEVHQLCEGQGWSFCIIGGVAVQRWGEVRLTKDVDLTVFTGFIGEEGFINVFLSKYNFRPPGTRAMAISSRVLLLENDREIPIDVALGGIGFERRTIERSSLWELPGLGSLRTCSAEDLLVHKCFANRDRDWVDVEGILARQWGRLNLELVRSELKPLAELKQEPRIVERLEQKIAHAAEPFTRIIPSKTKKNPR